MKIPIDKFRCILGEEKQNLVHQAHPIQTEGTTGNAESL